MPKDKESGESKLSRLRKKIEDKKSDTTPKTNPRDNPPAVKGEKNKHVTWGRNEDRNPKYKPKHDKK